LYRLFWCDSSNCFRFTVTIFCHSYVSPRNIHLNGPDFLIEADGKRIWIECIACEKGDGVDRVPDLHYGIVQNIPSDEILIRIASALKAKYDKYKKYTKDGIVKDTDQFIIAISRGDLGHADASIPLILRAVFGIGYQTLSMPRDGSPSKAGWSAISFIEKQNGSKVPMTFFLEKEHDGISAVIYSKETVLNHPDVIVRINFTTITLEYIVFLNKICQNSQLLLTFLVIHRISEFLEI
jgi:hypothetical protein